MLPPDTAVALLQEKMQARMHASEEIRRLVSHTQQLERLERLVSAAGEAGFSYPLDAQGEREDCMVMCGEKAPTLALAVLLFLL